MTLWRVDEAAEYLGIRPKTLYEWVRSGRVPHRKIGFNVRFDREEIEEWVADQSRRPDMGAAPSRPADQTRDEDGQPAEEPDSSARTGARPQAPPTATAIQEVQEAAADAGASLRRLQRDLGTHLSFPERQQLDKLATRLERAVVALTRAASTPRD